MRFARSIFLFVSLWSWLSAHALTPEVITALASGDTPKKLEIIGQLGAAGDASAIPILQALQDGALSITAAGQILLLGDDGAAKDAISGKSVDPLPDDAEKVTINNRVRRQLSGALAGLKLFAPEKETRLSAARELQENPAQELLPLISKAAAAEKDAEVRDSLILTQATINLRAADPKLRLKAVQALGDISSSSVKILLQNMAQKHADGSYAEADPAVRHAAQMAARAIDGRLKRIELLGYVFTGLSLGSVLLLAALGLAITFGLMGIINMAHGELLMIGAYATYVTQGIFERYWPSGFDWYLAAAVPAAFLIAGLVGMALERGVIRYLYGRPLETLLATWGISLVLIQIVRQLFGAQNVEVANPSWMSGGINIAAGLVLPYSRIVIIVFAAVVVTLVWTLMNKTRLGLFVRAVTQNRTMADCVGVPTKKIDTLTFGLGCGIAGLGGVALSQIGNVGPELGQSYIVDSFMVVVLGGVGQLAGTIIAATGLGVVNKFLEPYAGAVLGKIFVLIFIIMFIQRRPQGLFAIRGRSAEPVGV